MHKGPFFISIILWILGLLVIQSIPNRKVVEDEIMTIEGILVAVDCIKHRSVNTLKLNLIDEHDDVKEFFIPISFKIECNKENFSNYLNKTVYIDSFEGVYLGLKIDDDVIKDLFEEISKLNNDSNGKYFLILLISFSSLALYFYLVKSISF